MKNLFKNLVILSALIFTFACDTDPDNTIYDVLDFEKGAALRTINIGNALLNSSDPSSAFIVTVEAQDERDGGLLESVDVFVRLRDLTPDNGTNDVSSAFIKTYDASEFTTGPVGLPRITINVTYGEAFAALGIPASSVSPGDVFVMELNLNLTDGRTFGPDSSNSVLTGVFFRAPFAYNALITCSPEPGDYVVKMFDSYGDGWQTTGPNGGPGIMIDADGTMMEVGLCTPYEANTYDCTEGDFEGQATVTIPEGTLSASWTFPGDNWGEIRFEVYAPDGSLAYDSGDFGEQSAGLLPITVCAQ
jgi:hypothetical protein